jgi:hypothetical protein
MTSIPQERRRFRPRFVSLVATAICLFALWPAGIVLWQMLNAHREIARLDLGKGRFAVIAESRDWDRIYQHPAIHCKVVGKDWQSTFNWYNIGSVEDRDLERVEKKLLALRFSSVSAAGGDLIGIIEGQDPDTIVDLLDFRTHERWRVDVLAGEWKKKRVSELEAAYPGRTFKLRDLAR